nr:hypothetical protein HK105_002911 [Polyrhizophydium stewartii]
MFGAVRASAGADTVDQLFVKLGCVQARPVYAALMEAFRAKYPQSIPESRRAHVDLGSRDIKLAVFMSACTALGLKVDGRLRAEIGASTELVRRLEDKVGLLCKDEIQDLTRRADAATTPSGRPARLNRSHSMAEPSTPTRPTKRPPPPVDCAPGTSAADDDGAAMAALEHIANAEADPDTSKPSKPASKGAGRGKPQRVRRTTGINILVKPVDAASARLRVQLASWQATLLGTPAAAAEAVQSN